jgi:hypothetical protein
MHNAFFRTPKAKFPYWDSRAHHNYSNKISHTFFAILAIPVTDTDVHFHPNASFTASITVVTASLGPIILIGFLKPIVVLLSI